jgi:hypothetical protein
MLLGNGSMTHKLAENILFLKRLINFFYQHFAAGLRKGYKELLIVFFTSPTIRVYCTFLSIELCRHCTMADVLLGQYATTAAIK